MTEQDIWGEWNCSNAIHEIPRPYFRRRMRVRIAFAVLAIIFTVCGGLAALSGVWP